MRDMALTLGLLPSDRNSQGPHAFVTFGPDRMHFIRRNMNEIAGMDALGLILDLDDGVALENEIVLVRIVVVRLAHLSRRDLEVVDQLEVRAFCFFEHRELRHQRKNFDRLVHPNRLYCSSRSNLHLSLLSLDQRRRGYADISVPAHAFCRIVRTSTVDARSLRTSGAATRSVMRSRSPLVTPISLRLAGAWERRANALSAPAAVPPPSISRTGASNSWASDSLQATECGSRTALVSACGSRKSWTRNAQSLWWRPVST